MVYTILSGLAIPSGLSKGRLDNGYVTLRTIISKIVITRMGYLENNEK